LVDAKRIGENIRLSMSEDRFVEKNPALQITLSAGIAEAAEEESGEHVLARADKALYGAKDNGRNRVETG